MATQKKRAPAKKTAPPAKKKALPAKKTAPLAKKKAPPAKKKAPPAKKKALPAKKTGGLALDEQDIVAVPTAGAWDQWLEAHHDSAPHAWLRFAKKGSGLESPTYAEAVEVALTWGWIDGQSRSLDEHAWLQRYTPRRARSAWSRINRERAEALIASGRMKPPGLEQVELAKADGRWDAAYESPSRITVPGDLAAALDENPKAKAFFATLSSQNRYAILYRLHDAKRPETRARRLATYVGMLERGETLH